MRRAGLTLAAVFGIPLMLGAAGLIGLVGALIGEGPWNAIGAVLLAAPCATVVWARLRSPCPVAHSRRDHLMVRSATLPDASDAQPPDYAADFRSGR